MKRTVRDLLRHRPLGNFASVSVSASLGEALRALRIFNSGSLLVLDGQSLAGIFSERDFARRAITGPPLSLNEPVARLMVREVIYVTADYTLEECLAVMEEKHIRHLPVLDGATPLALLSMRHIMEVLIEDRNFMINELVRYVNGALVAPTDAKPTALPVLHTYRYPEPGGPAARST